MKPFCKDCIWFNLPDYEKEAKQEEFEKESKKKFTDAEGNLNAKAWYDSNEYESLEYGNAHPCRNVRSACAPKPDRYCGGFEPEKATCKDCKYFSKYNEAGILVDAASDDDCGLCHVAPRVVFREPEEILVACKQFWPNERS